MPVEARLKSTALNAQGTAGLDWTLVDLARGRRVDAAQAYAEAQGFALSSAQRRAVQAAVDLYLRSLFGERLIADARLSLERRTDQLRSITALVKAGIRPSSDAQRAEIEAVAARHAVEIRTVEYMATNAALAAALGEDPARPLRPAAVDPSTFSVPLALGDATRLALDHRPEVRQAEATLAARQAEHGAARAARAPTLGVAGNGQVSYTDILKGAGLSGEQYVGAAFGYLRWNALDATVWRQAKVTHEAVLEAQRQLEANILALRAEVAEATYAALRAQAQLAQAEEILSAASTARQAQNERYRAGAATLLELLDAEEIEQRARVTRIEVERDYHALRAALLAVCGVSERLVAGGAKPLDAPPK
jgi:multidrug efflux system outer membrane protein